MEATPDGFHRVSLTLDPKEIYGDSLRKEDFGGQSGGNLRVFAAVQSVEDHGCVMDVGVPGKSSKNLRIYVLFCTAFDNHLF